MYTELHTRYRNNPQAQRARDLISACVHCGFCLSNCPTYVETRDERDSPRGRIYLLRELLQHDAGADVTRRHLDRCLTCRSCETSCPSGVQYGHLADLGRELVEQHTPRPWHQRSLRWLLRKVMLRPSLLSPAIALGRLLRPVLPRALAQKVPAAQSPGAHVPIATTARRVLLLEGCVQRAATPATNVAAHNVLAKLGITLVNVPQATCCGALEFHNSAQDKARSRMRHNIDHWWPHIEAGAEALLSTATGCSLSLRDYGQLLADDPTYAAKAARISELATDLGALIAAQDCSGLQVQPHRYGRIALHIPCTAQHGWGQPDTVRRLLVNLGFPLQPTRDDHLCCGAAGSYSLLQPELSGRLRERKLNALGSDRVDTLVTANIGCQLQLQNPDSNTLHWIELLDSGEKLP